MEERKVYAGRDIEFERKEWTVQRVGWAVLALVIVAALLGLLGGSGPLAMAEQAASDGSLRVDYLRLDHRHAPGELTIEVAPAFVQAGEVRLWLDREYATRLGIERIVPEPESVEIEPERVLYVFAAGAQSGPLTITFIYEFEGYWRQQGRLGLTNGEAVELSQFVFP